MRSGSPACGAGPASSHMARAVWGPPLSISTPTVTTPAGASESDANQSARASPGANWREVGWCSSWSAYRNPGSGSFPISGISRGQSRGVSKSRQLKRFIPHLDESIRGEITAYCWRCPRWIAAIPEAERKRLQRRPVPLQICREAGEPEDRSSPERGRGEPTRPPARKTDPDRASNPAHLFSGSMRPALGLRGTRDTPPNSSRLLRGVREFPGRIRFPCATCSAVPVEVSRG